MRLNKLLSREHNAFSYQKVTIFEEGIIKGLTIEVTAETHKGYLNDFIYAFGVVGVIILAIKQVLLFPLLSNKLRNGIYLQNIAVDHAYRGQGIGTKLLNNVFLHAKKAGHKQIYLDVAIENVRAKKLYERVGFRVVKKRSVWALFPVTYLMNKDI